MISKITANSALPPIRQIGQELEQCLSSAGSFAFANTLLQDLKLLVEQSAERWIDIDVACQDGSNDVKATLEASGMWEFSDGDEPFGSIANRDCVGGLRFHFWNLGSPPVRRSGTLFRPVLIVSASTHIVADEYEIDSLVEDRALVVLLNGLILSSMSGQCWQIQTINTSEPFSSPPLSNLISGNDIALMEILIAYSLLNGIESLGNAFRLGLEGELRSFKARKAAITQRISISQQRSTVVPVAELLTDLRTRAQKHFGAFESGCAERMQNFLAPRSGALPKAIEDALCGISSLASERRSRSTLLRVDDADEERLLNLIRGQLHNHLLDDLRAMKDFFLIIGPEISKHVEAKAGLPLTIQFNYLTSDRITRVLDTTLVLQRRYQGESPNTGILEHFMAARRYLTILFMFLSALGLSFVRNYREFFIPVSIVSVRATAD